MGGFGTAAASASEALPACVVIFVSAVVDTDLGASGGTPAPQSMVVVTSVTEVDVNGDAKVAAVSVACSFSIACADIAAYGCVSILNQ